MNQRFLYRGLLALGLSVSAAGHAGTIVRFAVNMVTLDLNDDAVLERAIIFSNGVPTTQTPRSQLISSAVGSNIWTRGTVEIDVDTLAQARGWALGIDINKDRTLQTNEPYALGEVTLESQRVGGRALVHVEMPSCVCTNADASCSKIQNFAVRLVDPDSLAILWGSEILTRTVNLTLASATARSLDRRPQVLATRSTNAALFAAS